MDIAHQLPEVSVFLTQDGFEAIVKQMADAPVSLVERHGVAGEQRAHRAADRPIPGARKDVKVIRHKRKGVDRKCAQLDQAIEPVKEVSAVAVGDEDGAAFDPAPYQVMERSWCVESRTPRHDRRSRGAKGDGDRSSR